MVRAPNRTVTRALTIFLATGAYSGYSPFAPGTAGSAVGLLLVWGGFGPLWSRSPLAALVVFAGAFAISCAIAGRAEEIFNQPDCSKIVIDEILGMAAGFLAFRVFDVIKPFPAGLIDRRIGGGTGVMLDDLAAAIYANVVLQVARRLL